MENNLIYVVKIQNSFIEFKFAAIQKKCAKNEKIGAPEKSTVVNTLCIILGYFKRCVL